MGVDKGAERVGDGAGNAPTESLQWSHAIPFARPWR